MSVRGLGGRTVSNPTNERTATRHGNASRHGTNGFAPEQLAVGHGHQHLGAGAPTVSEVHERIESALATASAQLIAISHEIFDHPELAYEERLAHDVLCRLFEGNGFEVTRHAGGLETAFVAEIGRGGGPLVVLVCEYDALPGIGHACGHNLIAASGAGAALGAAAVVDSLDGRLRVVGTPAEEGGGGKIRLLNAGVFEGADAAMMIHPGGWDLTHMSTIAVHQVVATYSGKAAHAAAAPDDGVNALDAAVLGYVNVAALRQHIGDEERIHGVFTGGGDKPNIVPDSAQTHWYVRSPRVRSLEELKPRVEAALTAGAIAAGAAVELEWLDEPYAEMLDNSPLLARFAEYMAAAGRPLAEPDRSTRIIGSTDMGNLSFAVPSIHPILAAAPDGTPIHTTAFATAARSAQGDSAVLVGAAVMAKCAADLWSDPEFAAQVRSHFSDQRAAAVSGGA